MGGRYKRMTDGGAARVSCVGCCGIQMSAAIAVDRRVESRDRWVIQSGGGMEGRRELEVKAGEKKNNGG